jgi:hypothetical protein
MAGFCALFNPWPTLICRTAQFPRCDRSVSIDCVKPAPHKWLVLSRAVSVVSAALARIRVQVRTKISRKVRTGYETRFTVRARATRNGYLCERERKLARARNGVRDRNRSILTLLLSTTYSRSFRSARRASKATYPILCASKMPFHTPFTARPF